MVTPYEARKLPEINTGDELVANASREMLIAVQGYVYPSIGADAIMYALRWMRANPESADVLLGRDPAPIRPKPLRSTMRSGEDLCEHMVLPTESGGLACVKCGGWLGKYEL